MIITLCLTVAWAYFSSGFELTGEREITIHSRECYSCFLLYVPVQIASPELMTLVLMFQRYITKKNVEGLQRRGKKGSHGHGVSWNYVMTEPFPRLLKEKWQRALGVPRAGRTYSLLLSGIFRETAGTERPTVGCIKADKRLASLGKSQENWL